MEPELPVKRKKTSHCVNLNSGKQRIGDVHAMITKILTEDPSMSWWTIDFKPDQILMIFLPGIDYKLLLEHHESIPYINSLLQENSRYCMIEKATTNGYFADFILQQVPIEQKISTSGSGVEQFLLTTQQLLELNYPLIASEIFKQTSESGELSGLLGLDCEMVMTTKGSELARVSLVDSKYKVIYDEYVKTVNPVVDYLTQFSGITPKHLENAQKTFEEARNDLLSKVNANAVICGHSLDNDLNALKIVHLKVVDTSNLYPHAVASYKNGLKRLASTYLKRTIQNGKHDSIEDAIAALQLFQLKIKFGPQFGVPENVFCEKNLFESLSKSGLKSVICNSRISNDLIKGNVSIDHGPNSQKYIGSDYSLIITEWDDVKRLKSSEKEENICRILEEWDDKVKIITENCGNTVVLLMNGEGDVKLANEIERARSQGFSKWTIEQEKAWREAHVRLNSNFLIVAGEFDHIE